MDYVLGVDPGKKGAVALLEYSGAVERLEVMPSSGVNLAKLLTLMVNKYTIKMVYVEKAQAMPGQGVSSMFAYGMGFGEILGILYTLGVPHTLVSPRAWSKTLHQGTNSATTAKGRSKEAAERLFPTVRFLATTRSTKPHEGLIDAILIAEYGRRQMYGTRK